MKVNARILLIVLSIILVLSVTSCGSKTYDCAFCAGKGTIKCQTMKMKEYLSGQTQYGHDCSDCSNGIQICDRCNGTGKVTKD